MLRCILYLWLTGCNVAFRDWHQKIVFFRSKVNEIDLFWILNSLKISNDFWLRSMPFCAQNDYFSMFCSTFWHWPWSQVSNSAFQKAWDIGRVFPYCLSKGRLVLYWNDLVEVTDDLSLSLFSITPLRCIATENLIHSNCALLEVMHTTDGVFHFFGRYLTVVVTLRRVNQSRQMNNTCQSLCLNL